MKLTLFHYWRSSSSWRVRWALAHKRLPCEFRPIDLLNGENESAEHLKRNPLGYVPVLEIRENEGSESASLTESVAILEWLEERFPQNPLYPGTAMNRARIRQLCETINSDTQPLQNPSTLELVSSDPAERKRWAQRWIRKGLAAYETLAKPIAGRFSVGDALTAADVFLIPQLFNARRQEVRFEEFPLLQRIAEECARTASYRLSEPERFKPASSE